MFLGAPAKLVYYHLATVIICTGRLVIFRPCLLSCSAKHRAPMHLMLAHPSSCKILLVTANLHGCWWSSPSIRHQLQPVDWTLAEACLLCNQLRHHRRGSFGSWLSNGHCSAAFRGYEALRCALCCSRFVSLILRSPPSELKELQTYYKGTSKAHAKVLQNHRLWCRPWHHSSGRLLQRSLRAQPPASAWHAPSSYQTSLTQSEKVRRLCVVGPAAVHQLSLHVVLAPGSAESMTWPSG